MIDTTAYGLWPLVIINSFVFIVFAFSFTKPKTSGDWRSLGAFSAFIVALFTEMYGFPLTIYLLAGWLGSTFPGVDLFSHDNGHLWYTLLGMKGDPHMDLFHIISYIFILGGLALLVLAWNVLYDAQKTGQLANTGPYAYVRHPQYTAFMLIMVGFLIQWPTILTILMFPILVYVYRRLAFMEEKNVMLDLGDKYLDYASETPAFMPNLSKLRE